MTEFDKGMITLLLGAILILIGVLAWVPWYAGVIIGGVLLMIIGWIVVANN